jgi:hypothetical protein
MENDTISLQFPVEGIKIDNWTSYVFESDYFVPSDQFSFELSDDRAEQLKNKINIASPVELVINGQVECKGMVERIDFSYENGTKLKLTGRDILGIVCDGTMPPNIKITDTNTFEDALFEAFKTAGWSKDKIAFVNFNNFADFKPETSQKGSGRRKGKQIGHQLKPHKNEGFMEWALRICKRSGWNIKLTPNGEYIHIGSPSYETMSIDPILVHRITNSENNNVLGGELLIEWRRQPSYIIGEATGAGGNFRKGINTVFVPNSCLIDQSKTILFEYGKLSAGMKWVDQNQQLVDSLPKLLKDLFPKTAVEANTPESFRKTRPLYEYDDESKTMADLQYIMMHRMADFQNSFFQLNYSVDGHSYKVDGSVYNYAINSMCKIVDETYDFDNHFWIQKRTFTKSRSGGTRTELSLRLPYLYVFPELE